jgi:hypothetical protein
MIPNGTLVYYITGSCPEYYSTWTGTIEDFVMKYSDSDNTRLIIEYRISDPARRPSGTEWWYPDNCVFLTKEAAQEALTGMRANYYTNKIKHYEDEIKFCKRELSTTRVSNKPDE